MADKEMNIEFDQEVLNDILRAYLIIATQEDIIKEKMGEIATAFGVSKSLASKIAKSWCNDQLEKTTEKLQEERHSLANAELFIEACENSAIPKDSSDDDEDDIASA